MSEPTNQSSSDDDWGGDESIRQWPPVYRDGKVHVLRERCTTCVFRPKNLMHLTPGRLKGMVEDSVADQTSFACHQTLAYGDHTDHYEGEALCAGMVEKHGDKILPVRLAHAMNILEEVEPAPPKA